MDGVARVRRGRDPPWRTSLPVVLPVGGEALIGVGTLPMNHGLEGRATNRVPVG